MITGQGRQSMCSIVIYEEVSNIASKYSLVLVLETREPLRDLQWGLSHVSGRTNALS